VRTSRPQSKQEFDAIANAVLERVLPCRGTPLPPLPWLSGGAIVQLAHRTGFSAKRNKLLGHSRPMPLLVKWGRMPTLEAQRG
jgi:hypothetical protein